MVSAPRARGAERRLVDQVREIGAGEARACSRAIASQIDVGRERLALGVHAAGSPARAAQLGPIDDHAPIEAARAQQRRVEHVGPVRRRDDDDAGRCAMKPSISDEQLVQRLLALVVAAAEAGAARRAPRRRSRR